MANQDSKENQNNSKIDSKSNDSSFAGNATKSFLNIASSAIIGSVEGIAKGTQKGIKGFFKGAYDTTKNAWNSMKAPENSSLLRKSSQNTLALLGSIIAGAAIGVIDFASHIVKETLQGFSSGVKSELKTLSEKIPDSNKNPETTNKDGIVETRNKKAENLFSKIKDKLLQKSSSHNNNHPTPLQKNKENTQTR